MFKTITSFLCAFLLSSAALFGAVDTGPNAPPPRTDYLDGTSVGAKIKLQRAEKILATLVKDPQDYNLVLSNTTSFGGEAVSAGVYSDKPTIIVYQGALSPDRSNQELAFMMAHELGHVKLQHNEKMDRQIDKIFQGPPAGYSGTNFAIFFQKLQEQRADMFGFDLYKKAGYDLNFFPFTLHLLKINPNIHYGTTRVFRKDPPSLSMRDSHFNMKERFELLVQKAGF